MNSSAFDSNSGDKMIHDDVNALVRLDGANFVRGAYLTILRREPDASGAHFYLSRMNAGISKRQIVAELYLSAEGQAQRVALTGVEEVVAAYQSSGPLRFLKRVMASISGQSVRPAEMAVRPTVQETAPVVVPPPPIPVPVFESRSEPAFWMDLTATMEWHGGVVGIIRAELETAHALKKQNPKTRFSMRRGNGFVEISAAQLKWLFEADNVAQVYLKMVGKEDANKPDDGTPPRSLAEVLGIAAPDNAPFFHPYIEGDTIYSCGWVTSGKEAYFSRLKNECPGVYLIYLVYDVILLRPGTHHLYDKWVREQFERYLKWVAENADFVLYGGQTAQKDTEAIYAERAWRRPAGDFVKHGSDFARKDNAGNDARLLESVGVKGPFVITVGSIEPRKNHDTLYRAMLLALEQDPTRVPQLIICGKPWLSDDLMDALNRDPRLKGAVIRLSPSDEQLAALYRNCLFTLLPSLYEGWSLTLPESLDLGKFCLACDNPPLRETGRDLVDYVPGWDVAAWAEKIVFYANNPDVLREREARIARLWTPTTWSDTAQMIRAKIAQHTRQRPARRPEPTVWMDLTTTYLDWKGGVQGIIRAELTYARYLRELAPNTRFFACHEGWMFEILPENLEWLFSSSDLATSYKNFHTFYEQHESAGTGCRHPFQHGAHADHPRVLREFPDNSIVFFAAIDWYPRHPGSRSFQAAAMASKKRHVTVSQLIYDFTPMLIPHHHVKETVEGYEPFIQCSSEKFHHLVYGGRTARRDGIRFQKERGWPSPPSDFVEFGSDILETGALSVAASPAEDRAVLQALGVESKFIMTVGTLQPRKNQEMLYKAYVTLIEQGYGSELPQMLFVGGKGWNSDDFMRVFSEDERIRGRILLLRPTDAELNVLYRHCAFTLLPSFYEGWSLTLPESLSYGKFCLTSDCDPLRETGRDLVEYINPLDTYKWAERILHYARHPEEVAEWERRIRRDWKSRSWKGSTVMLLEALHGAHARRIAEVAAVKS